MTNTQFDKLVAILQQAFMANLDTMLADLKSIRQSCERAERRAAPPVDLDALELPGDPVGPIGASGATGAPEPRGLYQSTPTVDGVRGAYQPESTDVGAAQPRTAGDATRAQIEAACPKAAKGLSKRGGSKR